MLIEVVQGDITRLRVDAIVNAANSSLSGGGGVDGAIHAAAGPQLALAARRHAPLAAGAAVATPAFGLAPAITWVIHTVGPVWRGGASGEPEALGSCYRECLRLAADLGASDVAFPAVSTGVYGYPAQDAAAVAVTTLRATAAELGTAAPRRVLLVAYNAAAEQVLSRAMSVTPASPRPKAG